MAISNPAYSINEVEIGRVKNLSGQNLAIIQELMINTETETVEYAVLSFDSFMGMGDSHFVVPWSVMSEDNEAHCYVLDADMEQLKALLVLARITGPSWPVLNFCGDHSGRDS